MDAEDLFIYDGGIGQRTECFTYLQPGHRRTEILTEMLLQVVSPGECQSLVTPPQQEEVGRGKYFISKQSSKTL
jgi:hypothetical protein